MAHKYCFTSTDHRPHVVELRSDQVDPVVDAWSNEYRLPPLTSEVCDGKVTSRDR